MHEICKNVKGIEYPHQSILIQESDNVLPIADKKTSAEPVTEQPVKTPEKTEDTTSGKNIEGSYKEHYGKTKAEVDAENRYILETQKKCLDFVQKNQGHPEVCEWCQKEYKKPQVVWKWNPEEETWYRWYDGGWHYWGPSKDGFTEGGWSWYNGYWHNDGYTFKYENGKWYRFQDKEWVIYGKEVPVDPQPPTAGKICRPFYKMMKQGFPVSLASTQVPRCKVGDAIYMWTDEAACKFLGGVKAYQERVNCKSGESHKWKRVVKCVSGPQKLANGGLDYKTGQLHANHYKFQNCKIYYANAGAAWFIYLFGKLQWIPSQPLANLYDEVHGTKVTISQLKSVPQEGSISADAVIYSAQGGSHFLRSHGKMMQFESENVFNVCGWAKDKVKPMSDEEFAK